MAFILEDFIRETTETAGTDDLALAGAVSGFKPFSSALSDGDTTIYGIFASDGSKEAGLGTYVSASNTLQRTTIKSSTDGDAKLDLPSGTHIVFIGPDADGMELAYSALQGTGINDVVILTEDEYAALGTPDEDTLYITTDSVAAGFATAAQGALADSALQPDTIGTDIQAYDADTAKLNTAQDWTAIQDFTAGLTGGADSTTPSANATLALDGKAKVIVPSQTTGTITLSFSTPSGSTTASVPILIKQGGDAKAVAWGSSAILLGTAPTMEANKDYLFGAFTFDGGTSYYVQVGQAEE